MVDDDDFLLSVVVVLDLGRAAAVLGKTASDVDDATAGTDGEEMHDEEVVDKDALLSVTELIVRLLFKLILLRLLFKLVALASDRCCPPSPPAQLPLFFLLDVVLATGLFNKERCCRCLFCI